MRAAPGRGEGTYLLELSFELEEERGLVSLKARAAVVVLAEGRIYWGAFWLVCRAGGLAGSGGELGRGEDVAGADAGRGRECCGLGCGAIVGEGRDDFLEGLVVEVVGGPARDLLRLDLLAELQRRDVSARRSEGESGRYDLHGDKQLLARCGGRR